MEVIIDENARLNGVDYVKGQSYLVSLATYEALVKAGKIRIIEEVVPVNYKKEAKEIQNKVKKSLTKNKKK